MNHLSRRQFITLLGSAAAASACVPFGSHFPESKSTVETIYSGYREGEPYIAKEAGMHIGSTNQNIRVPLKNEIHSVLHSAQKDLKIFISKLETHSYVQKGNGPYLPLVADEGNYFYGHGVIDETRNVLYTSQARITKSRDENDRTDEPGYIYMYSLDEQKVISRFPSFGNDPHDLKLLDDQLIVCNGGRNTNVAFIDLATKKLVKSYPIKGDHLSLRHIEIVDNENFLIASLSVDLNKTCPLYLLNKQTGFAEYKMPENADLAILRAQILSVLHYKNYVFATVPFTSTLTVWKITGEYIGSCEIPAACNLAVSIDQDGVIVGSGEAKERARLVKIKNNALVVKEITWAQGITGAHSLLVRT